MHKKPVMTWIQKVYVKRVIIVNLHIIKLRNYIIQKNTKKNFAHIILITFKNVLMEYYVHSHTVMLISKSNYSILNPKINIFICLNIKQYFVLMVLIMIENSVFMHIICKIIEEI